MTIGQICRKNNKEFIKWGIKSKFYGWIGKMFRSKKYLDKSVYYLDKRWNMMMSVLSEQERL